MPGPSAATYPTRSASLALLLSHYSKWKTLLCRTVNDEVALAFPDCRPCPRDFPSTRRDRTPVRLQPVRYLRPQAKLVGSKPCPGSQMRLNTHFKQAQSMQNRTQFFHGSRQGTCVGGAQQNGAAVLPRMLPRFLVLRTSPPSRDQDPNSTQLATAIPMVGLRLVAT